MIYTFRSMKSSRLMSLLIALQLAAVFAVVIIMDSAVYDRTIYYDLVKNPISKHGIVFTAPYMKDEFKNEESIKALFPKADSVYGNATTFAFTDQNKEIQSAVNWYSEEVFEKIPPRLKSGSLPRKRSDGIWEILVCDGFGYKTGDMVTLTELSGNSTEFCICGIMQDQQYILGSVEAIGDYDYKVDYRDFFYPLNSSLLKGPVFVSSKEIKAESKMSSTLSDNSRVIVNYKSSDYSDDEILDLSSELGLQNVIMTEHFYSNSQKHINEQIYILLPVIAAILIITLFTAITTSIISTMRNLRSYAVLYLCGATWKRCSLINLFDFILISASAALADTAFFVIGKSSYLKNTVVFIRTESLIICAGITMLLLLLSAVVPLLVVRNKQPRDVLKTEFRQ